MIRQMSHCGNSSDMQNNLIVPIICVNKQLKTIKNVLESYTEDFF